MSAALDGLAVADAIARMDALIAARLHAAPGSKAYAARRCAMAQSPSASMPSGRFKRL